MEGESSSDCGKHVPSRECWEAQAGESHSTQGKESHTVTRETEEIL